MAFLRKILKIFGVFLFLAVAFFATLAAVATLDPLLILPKPRHGLMAERAPLAPLLGRPMEHITLRDGALGGIGFALSLPSAAPEGKIPVLIVLGGLGRGEDNIRYIDYAGNNAVVGFDWPMPVRFPESNRFLQEAPGLYFRILTIPGQIVSMTRWLAGQPWADPARFTLAGFSFGALALPAAEAMAARDGEAIGWTIIGYGGAPFGQLFVANSSIEPLGLRRAMAPLIDALLYPVEPTVYLPRLKSRFLVIEGGDDQVVPLPLRQRLTNAVPEPKTVLVFPGNHIGVGPQSFAVLKEVMDTSKKWLINEGAVNP